MYRRREPSSLALAVSVVHFSVSFLNFYLSNWAAVTTTGDGLEATAVGGVDDTINTMRSKKQVHTMRCRPETRCRPQLRIAVR